MKEQKGGISTRTKGFYSKQLAALENKTPAFKRGKKKEIRKENKQSCRETRERKKQYILSLQAQRNSLTEENKHLKEELQHLRNLLEHNKKEIGTESDQRIKMLSSEYRELMIALTKKDKSSISRSLAVLRDKFGISGRQRRKWMHQNLMRAIQLSMPLHFRILIENVDDSFKFFQLLGGNDEMRSYRLNFGETEKSILKQMKPRIKKAKARFNSIFEHLHGAWTELTRYSFEAQKIIDSIEDNLDPVFVGNLLVNLDSKRCSSEQIRAIYPINYFTSMPDEPEQAGLQQIQSSILFNSEDNFAFEELFKQFQ